jgi:hypothetical protein
MVEVYDEVHKIVVVVNRGDVRLTKCFGEEGKAGHGRS